MNAKYIYFFVLGSVGQLQAQVCFETITETNPTSEFTVNNDGTVTHEETGLIWMQCSLGQSWNAGDCLGIAGEYSWSSALQAAEQNDMSGYSDWRLPNIKELASITELSCKQPAINLTIFPATPTSRYWSSTSNVNSALYSWQLDFNYGSVTEVSGIKYDDYPVRLVRG